MTNLNIERSLTGRFAAACEQLNDFARSLREQAQFVSVRTGADIRFYLPDWRLEKWVEAEIVQGNLWAVWWIDFGPRNDGWIIESHVAVDPDFFHLEFPPAHTTSAENVPQMLSDAVTRLKAAMRENCDFAEAVKAAHNE